MSPVKKKDAKKAPSASEDLKKRDKAALEGGGAAKQRAQKEKGKFLARERIDLLLDEGSFQEFDRFVETASSEFGLDKKRVPGDGVVTGIGKVDGRPVAVFSQDFTVMGGSLGLAHARKITKIMDLAVENGFPIVGFCDSGGARIQEGVHALGGYAEIFYRNVQASGRVPQISAILGPCAGGAVYSPALTDFVFMVKDTAHMFITGPEVVRAATGEECDFETLGGAAMHAEKSGVVHFKVNSEHQCIRQIRELLSFLPAAHDKPPVRRPTSDRPNRTSAKLEALSEMEHRQPYRMHDVIWEIADDQGFFEAHRDFAKNLICGFIHLDGWPVGVVANDPSHLSGALDIDASDKGARFINFCDAFNIPLLTLVDVPGYWPGLEQERGGIIRHGAKLLYAFSMASVPKVTVIVRKAYGGAYDVMSSKHIRADMNFAWPGAEIAVMGPQGAANILFAREIRQSKDPEKTRAEKIDAYTRRYATPYMAAEAGYIDEVIFAKETRPKVAAAFDLLRDKKRARWNKKHGNMPV